MGTGGKGSVMRLNRKFLMVFAPGIALCALVLAVIFNHEISIERERARVAEQRVVDLVAELFQRTLSRVEGDLFYLAQQSNLRGLLNGRSDAGEILEREYAVFIERRGVYDQIRYIDASGREQVRVDYRDGSARIVPRAELQDKSGRYYFDETMAMPTGKMYVSPFDLNIERGEIEQPLKPMIRFALPLRGLHGEARGILILNYLGQELIDIFDWVGKYAASDMWLLNASGYWIVGSGPEDEWGFMYPDRVDVNLAMVNPGLWREVEGDELPQLEFEGSLYTHTHVCGPASCPGSGLDRVHPGAEVPYEAGDFPWTIVSRADADRLSALGILYRNGKALLPVVVVLMLILALAGMLAWRLARSVETLIKRESQIRQMEKMDALGQMAGGIAHDFNNVLGIAIGHLDALRRDAERGNVDAARVGRLEHALGRASSLTRKLLDFSHDNRGERKVVDVGVELSRMEGLLANTLTPRIALSMSLDDHGARANLDVAEFENAIINLSLNARDAMDGSGAIAISSRRRGGAPTGVFLLDELPDGEYVEVRVADTGAGIDRNEFARIFEPFYTTKHVGKGTGLGLASVLRFARRAGGTVGVESAIGSGTRFSLFVPVYDGPLVAERRVADSGAPEPVGDGLRGKRLLMVEDEPDLAEMAVEILEDAGVEVTAVGSAEAALDLLEAGRFDAVFTDVILPGSVDGIDIASAAVRRDAAVRVLLTSGNPLDALERQKKSGLDFEVLPKPYSDDQLLQHLRRLFR